MYKSSTDADRMEVVKSWFPWMIDTVSRVTYAEAKTKLRDEVRNEVRDEVRNEVRDEVRDEERAQTRQAIIQLLQTRFGNVPQSIEADLEKINNSAKLSRLIVVAGTATSLDDVAGAIRKA